MAKEMTGGQLRRIRADLGLTMADFGELIGVDKATISRWEAGLIKIPRIAEIAIRAQAEKMNGVVNG